MLVRRLESASGTVIRGGGTIQSIKPVRVVGERGVEVSDVTPDPRSSEDRWAVVLAGPNGAGKTTLARGILPADALYLNADVVAGELRRAGHPAATVDIAAARLVLASLRQAVRDGSSFCIETNLAGPGLQRHIRQWKADGYQVQLVFVWLNSVELALQRVAARVERGGHNVPPDVIRRRYRAGLATLDSYFTAVDTWQLFDNDDADRAALLVAEGEGDAEPIVHNPEAWMLLRSSIAAAQADVAIAQDRRLGAGDLGL